MQILQVYYTVLYNNTVSSAHWPPYCSAHCPFWFTFSAAPELAVPLCFAIFLTCRSFCAVVPFTLQFFLLCLFFCAAVSSPLKSSFSADHSGQLSPFQSVRPFLRINLVQLLLSSFEFFSLLIILCSCSLPHAALTSLQIILCCCYSFSFVLFLCKLFCAAVHFPVQLLLLCRSFCAAVPPHFVLHSLQIIQCSCPPPPP